MHTSEAGPVIVIVVQIVASVDVKCVLVMFSMLLIVTILRYFSSFALRCSRLAIYAELSVVVFWTALLVPPAPASFLGLRVLGAPRRG